MIMRRLNLFLAALWMTTAPILASCVVEPVTETETLTGITQINEDGFGSGDLNGYAWCMAVFNDELYVGTLTQAGEGTATQIKGDASPLQTEGGCEIWRYNGTSWTQVVTDGLGDPENRGMRNLKVINGCLYGVTRNEVEGMEVWRSCNGTDWERLATGGFGLGVVNNSGRALTSFNGHIYVGTDNHWGGQIWRSSDGVTWEQVASAGISDINNIWIAEFAEFNGWLYIGTNNILGGFQVYRTQDGLDYQRVHQGGPGQCALTLSIFNNRLFLGTADIVAGFRLYVTDDGLDYQVVLEDGFTSLYNRYLWSMQEYNGRLYAGTYTGALVLWGAFQLFSSADGEAWIVEDANGFNYPYQYGIRSMTVFNGKLILGTATASPEGCKVFEASAK